MATKSGQVQLEIAKTRNSGHTRKIFITELLTRASIYSGAVTVNWYTNLACDAIINTLRKVGHHPSACVQGHDLEDQNQGHP